METVGVGLMESYKNAAGKLWRVIIPSCTSPLLVYSSHVDFGD
jgi:hypothetical protein